MARDLLDGLDEWKRRYETSGTSDLERLLLRVERHRFRTPGELIRLHETLLFLRAYPKSPEVARLADRILFAFAGRVAGLARAGVDLTPFEEPEVSGIAGTSLSAVFTLDVAERLAALHPGDIEIAWDRYDENDRLGALISRIAPLAGEDWPVEAHAPLREWTAAVRHDEPSDLQSVINRVRRLPLSPRDQAHYYDTARLPLTWNIGASARSRSRLRLPGRKLFVHREPLIDRRAVSLIEEFQGAPIPVRRLTVKEGRQIVDLIVETSAMRYRELYGFSHPDERGVYHADAGRGVEIYFFGIPPEWRLPMRAYHAGMFFKNGVPAGYVELLSLFDRAEVGFNLYYTFREGESAWIYARLLHLFRQELGVNCFSVDPYQIGHENPEAINSGAFWFYRKLGFRPVDPAIVRLVEREEEQMRKDPAHRSSKRALEKLADGYILFDGPGAEPGAWDRFRVRHLALALQRAGDDAYDGLSSVLRHLPGRGQWTEAETQSAADIVRMKESGTEARYLRLMQRHARMRAGFQALGSA